MSGNLYLHIIITHQASHFTGAKTLQAVLPSNKRLLTLHNPHMSSATLCPHAAVGGAGNAAEKEWRKQGGQCCCEAPRRFWSAATKSDGEEVLKEEE